MPPAFRPYSAAKLLVRILYSAMASGLGLKTTPLLRRLLLLPPSRMNVFESLRPPEMLNAVVALAVPPLPLLSAGDTPGCKNARSSTLRPLSGRLTIGRLVTD